MRGFCHLISNNELMDEPPQFPAAALFSFEVSIRRLPYLSASMVVYMKYLYPSGEEKKPLTLLLII